MIDSIKQSIIDKYIFNQIPIDKSTIKVTIDLKKEFVYLDDDKFIESFLGLIKYSFDTKLMIEWATYNVIIDNNQHNNLLQNIFLPMIPILQIIFSPVILMIQNIIHFCGLSNKVHNKYNIYNMHQSTKIYKEFDIEKSINRQILSTHYKRKLSDKTIDNIKQSVKQLISQLNQTKF